MENQRRRIEAAEFPLPEVLIQHTQSFLDAKEAAQTCILSKSWHSAWSTRPNLEFDQRHFQNRYNEWFWELVKTTIQRYEALNLRIQTFGLWALHLLRSECGLAKELIAKAMKMGAVDFSFELRDLNQTFTLPPDVLESETLINLSVNRCTIDTRANTNVSCPNLKSLCLKSIQLDDDKNCNKFCNLLSSCPLIEKLLLGYFTVLQLGQVAPCGLESVTDVLQSNLYNMLKSLFLVNVEVDPLFFSNVSSNFPRLKDLSLEDCWGYNHKEIRLYSRTLECISFEQTRLLRAVFDVPSIRKFEFSGRTWPLLYFETTSREWKSHIKVTSYSPSTAWFLELKKLLIGLSSSKISLTLNIDSIVEQRVGFKRLREIGVENLTIYAPSSVWFRALECLLRSSRPKFITLHLMSLWSRTGKGKNDFLENFSKRNVEGVRESFLMMNRDLAEVEVQLFEESVAERQPLPERVHFHLRWRAQV